MIDGDCETDEHFLELSLLVFLGSQLMPVQYGQKEGQCSSIVEACWWSHLLLSALITCSFYSRLSLPFAVGGFISILPTPRRTVEVVDSLPLSLRADRADRSIADATSTAVGTTQRRSWQRAHLVLGWRSRSEFPIAISEVCLVDFGTGSVIPRETLLAMVLASSRYLRRTVLGVREC